MYQPLERLEYHWQVRMRHPVNHLRVARWFHLSLLVDRLN